MATKKKAPKPTAKRGAKGDSGKTGASFSDPYLEKSFRAGPKTSPDKQLVNLGLDWPSAELNRTRPRLLRLAPNPDGLVGPAPARSSSDRGITQGANPFYGKPDPDPGITRKQPSSGAGAKGDAVRMKKTAKKKGK